MAHVIFLRYEFSVSATSDAGRRVGLNGNDEVNDSFLTEITH